MSVSVFPGFGKKKVGKVEYFGGNWNKITENFVSCLTAFDVNMNFPSGSYNMCFNAGKANLMLSLENSMTIGLEFKTKYSLNNISFYAFSYNYDYKPADTEKSDNIAKIGFNQATVGAAKDYTLESEKNIVFACFRGSGTINHDIYQKVKDVRQVLIDDQEIALKNKVFEKELKEAEFNKQKLWVLKLDASKYAGQFDQMEVWLSQKDFSPVRLFTVDPSGNSSWYNIINLKVVKKVSPEDFKFKPVKDVDEIDMR